MENEAATIGATTAPDQRLLHGAAARGLGDVQAACAAHVPGRLADLAAQRVRELVDPQGGPHLLAGWPTAPDLTPLERAAIALAEQFVIDVNGVSDELIEPLAAAMTRDEVYLLCRAIQAAEVRIRAALVLRHEAELSDVVDELRAPVGAR